MARPRAIANEKLEVVLMTDQQLLLAAVREMGRIIAEHHVCSR
jgi:hypothetical protein